VWLKTKKGGGEGSSQYGLLNTFFHGPYLLPYHIEGYSCKDFNLALWAIHSIKIHNMPEFCLLGPVVLEHLPTKQVLVCVHKQLADYLSVPCSPTQHSCSAHL